jgi:hypothetical protein
MGGLVPRLNCPDEARRSNPHRRPPCVIRFPSRGSCELPLPEGLVGFAKRLLLRDTNVFEEVMIVAFGDLAECAALPRACNPLSDRRGQARYQAVNPWSLTNQVVKRKSLSTQRQSARDWRKHGKDPDFRVEPDGSPTKRSRINRRRHHRSAKHRFSGLPEFYS